MLTEIADGGERGGKTSASSCRVCAAHVACLAHLRACRALPWADGHVSRASLLVSSPGHEPYSLIAINVVNVVSSLA